MIKKPEFILKIVVYKFQLTNYKERGADHG